MRNRISGFCIYYRKQCCGSGSASKCISWFRNRIRIKVMRTQFNPIAALLLESEFYIPLSLCWSRNHPCDRRSHHPANNHHHCHRHRLTDPTHHHPPHNHHRRCPCRRLCFFGPVLHPPMRKQLHRRRRQPLCWPRQSPEYQAGPRRSLARPGRTRHGVAWPLFGLCLLRIWWWPFPFLSDCCHLLKNQISIFKNLFKAN
jgi:hypothetical protein